jgi:hypothetical protein
MHPDAARVGLSLFEIPVAIGLGFAAFWGVYWLGCSFSHCVDLSGLPWLVAGAVAGLGVAVCYWLAMLRSGPPFRRRLIWDGVALVIGIASYVVPVTLSHMAEARSIQATKDAADLRAHQRIAWIDSLKANAHGPPGEVPAMLSVVDDGAVVAVTNNSGMWKTVALAKVVPNATASDGWYGCAMYSETDQRYYRYSIGPRQTVRYRLDPACAVAFSGAAIEFRVGDGPGEDGWWSDSAFATPDGRNRGGAFPSRPPTPTPDPKIGGAPP